MQQKLVEQILESYNSYKNTILVALEDYEYRKKRYGVEYTVALYITTKELSEETILKSVRDTDNVLFLSKNFVAVVFDFSDTQNGLKAAENLLMQLEPQMFHERIYVSVVNSKGTMDDDELVRHAFDLLIDEIKSGEDGIPNLENDTI
jgi:hypothetical protein